MVETISTTLNIDDLIVKLSKLEEQIKRSRTERDNHNQLTKTSLNSRNEANQLISQSLETAKEFASKRDEFNLQVKELKRKRKELQTDLTEKKNKLNDSMDASEPIDRKNVSKQRFRMKTLTKQIQDIEWNLQTKVLSSEEEKEMILQAGKLSEQMNKIGEKINLTTQQSVLWKEISSTQKKIHQLHIEIIDLAKESQVYHNMMNQNFSLVNDIRKRANKYHKQFIDSKKRGDSFHRELLTKVSEKNDTRKQLRILKKQVRDRRQEKIQTSLDEHVQKAYKKYEDGANLSMDEFRLLVNRGLI